MDDIKIRLHKGAMIFYIILGITMFLGIVASALFMDFYKNNWMAQAGCCVVLCYMIYGSYPLIRKFILKEPVITITNSSVLLMPRSKITDIRLKDIHEVVIVNNPEKEPRLRIVTKTEDHTIDTGHLDNSPDEIKDLILRRVEQYHAND